MNLINSSTKQVQEYTAAHHMQCLSYIAGGITVSDLASEIQADKEHISYLNAIIKHNQVQERERVLVQTYLLFGLEDKF